MAQAKMRTSALFLAFAFLNLALAQEVTNLCAENLPGIPFNWRSKQKRLALTFDDGPDAPTLKTTLDVLAKYNIKATFLVNARRYEWTTDLLDPISITQLRRIFSEGHEFGSHTVNHLDLSTLTDTAIQNTELNGLLTFYRNALGSLPRITLFRAPFGLPFYNSPDNYYTTGYTGQNKRVGDIIKKAYVNIAWSWSNNDFDYNDAASLIAAYGDPLIQANVTGSILMHGPHGMGAFPDALEALILKWRAAGYTFCKTEDLIQERYGMSSAQVIDTYNACNAIKRPPPPPVRPPPPSPPVRPPPPSPSPPPPLPVSGTLVAQASSEFTTATGNPYICQFFSPATGSYSIAAGGVKGLALRLTNAGTELWHAQCITPVSVVLNAGSTYTTSMRIKGTGCTAGAAITWWNEAKLSLLGYTSFTLPTTGAYVTVTPPVVTPTVTMDYALHVDAGTNPANCVITIDSIQVFVK